MVMHVKQPPHITYHRDLLQGGDEWLEARRGLLTASEMCRIITPTLKVANNDKSRAHCYELLAQRISGYVEPAYIGDDMLRGREEEHWARVAYAQHIALVTEVGFITNSRWGFTIGYSPDGLVGSDGLIEIKGRRQKFQVETILENDMPTEYAIQVQTGLLVTERAWCDFISYSGGLPMVVVRVLADEKMQAAIVNAAAAFEADLAEKRAAYEAQLESTARLFPTERRVFEEISL